MLRKLANPPTKTCSATPYPGMAIAVFPEVWPCFCRMAHLSSCLAIIDWSGADLDKADEHTRLAESRDWGRKTEAWTLATQKNAITNE